MAPRGHGFMPMKQQQREFAAIALPPIVSGKTFTNPNFVNGYNKYNNSAKPVDSSAKFENSCRLHIIDSIKKQCPKIITTFEEPAIVSAQTNQTIPAMCLGNHTTKSGESHPEVKNMRQLSKDSIENEKRPEIFIEESMESTLDDSEICCSPRIDSFLAKPKSSPNMQGPSEMMGSPLERLRQLSVTDSENSFVVFDHEGNEEHLEEDEEEYEQEDFIGQESLCRRLRKPSVCESEDSFILFEHDDTTALENNESDYYYDSSSDEESDQKSDCHDDQHDDNHFDETDSAFSIVQPKKVRFASEHSLCQVHPMVKWSYAYQAARKGPWEMYARDRCRFKERAHKIERDIKHVFDPQHREKIFKERFENL